MSLASTEGFDVTFAAPRFALSSSSHEAIMPVEKVARAALPA